MGEVDEGNSQLTLIKKNFAIRSASLIAVMNMILIFC